MTASGTGAEPERLRSLIADLDVVVWEADAASGRFTFVSAGAEDVLGYPTHLFVDEPSFWADHVHAEDRERTVDGFLAAVEAGAAFDLEFRFLQPDGAIAWIRDIGHTATREDGSPVVVRGVMIDVTKRHAEERHRAEVEERYRRVVEQLPGMVYLESVEPYDDVPGDLLFISPQVERILGVSATAWTQDGGAWRAHLHPDDLDALRGAYRDAIATGAFRADYRMLARDGDVVWIHAEATLVRGDDGTPQFWQGVMFDATEQTRAELQLREAEERYRALVEQTPAVTYIDDVDTPRTVYISPQVERLLGYPAAEFTGAEPLWPWILHPDDRERLIELSERADRTHEPFNEEYRMVAKDGRIVWVHDQSVLIRDEHGEARYWQGVWIDVTERKRAAELERALEVERREAAELRALDEMKNTFLQAVSHDLRTPLAAILGLAVTIEKQRVGGDEAAELSSRIAANARKLDRMVTDLLDMDRLSRGIVEPKLETTDVGALVSRVVEEAEVISGRGVSVDVERVTADVDVAKLERIVENLLVNAVRHTPSDASIWVGVHRDDDGVDIVVEDDGPGVPEDEREAIFQPFHQASPSEEAASPGVGIGLALVARFAELHGGHAWVDERAGGGAAFHVWLPARESEDAETTV